MQWKELTRRLIGHIERRGALADETAMVRVGDVLYELDLYRSAETGRLHLGAKFPGVDAQPEHIEDAIETSSIQPDEQPDEAQPESLAPKSNWLEKLAKGENE